MTNYEYSVLVRLLADQRLLLSQLLGDPVRLREILDSLRVQAPSFDRVLWIAMDLPVPRFSAGPERDFEKHQPESDPFHYEIESANAALEIILGTGSEIWRRPPSAFSPALRGADQIYVPSIFTNTDIKWQGQSHHLSSRAREAIRRFDFFQDVSLADLDALKDTPRVSVIPTHPRLSWNIQDRAATVSNTDSVRDADTLGELFARELESLLGDQAVLVDEEAVRRGARAAAAEMAWARRLRTVFLRAADVALMLDTTPERIGAMVEREELLALWRADEPSFPAWQFASSLDDKRRAAIAHAHALYVSASGSSPWSVASWLIEDHPELDGVSPVAWIRMGADPDTVFQVARRDAARATL